MIKVSVAAAASQSRSAAEAAQQVSTASSTAPSGVAVPTFLSPGGTLKPTARRANGEPIAPVGGELQTSADIVRLFMKPDKRSAARTPRPCRRPACCRRLTTWSLLPMAPTPAARWVPTGSRTSVPAQCSRWHRWKLAYPPSVRRRARARTSRRWPAPRHLPRRCRASAWMDRRRVPTSACATRLRRDQVLLPPSASPQRPPQTRARWSATSVGAPH